MNKQFTDTFCVLPWIHMASFPNGRSPVCYMATEAPDNVNLNTMKN